MHDWMQRYASKRLELDQAIRRIPRGKRIFIGSGAAEPVGLVEEMVAQYQRFADNPILHLMTLGPAPYAEPEYRDHFRHNAFFIGRNVRDAVRQGRADYTPVFLSQIPDLLRRRKTAVDVALIQVAPPDKFGFVNLGVSVDIVLAAIEAASLVIAEVNPNMPRVFGAGYVPMDTIDAWVWRPSSLPEVPPEPLDDVARRIGANVASLIEDGATLQVGIGQIPDAVLGALGDHSDLGVWTEMFSDGSIELIENGNITGKYKTMHPRMVTSSFTFGSSRTYAAIDQNPVFTFHPSEFVNDPMNVARQHKMVAINGALQIDLTGQVCADSIGSKFYSGIGGQVDFIRGASMCPGGKPIIAIRSTAKRGEISRIVPTLTEGAGVVTSRGDVRFVVTEHGIADLQGLSVRQRATALVAIAEPDHRSALLDAAKHRRYVFADQITRKTDYPEEYERQIESRRGDPFLLRPIREVDEEAMRDMFYALTEDTKVRRWFTPQPHMHHRDLMRYLAVDDVRHVAIVIETQPDEEERAPELVGVGRYHCDPRDDFADVAVVIRDEHQGLGLGTAVVEHLAEIARHHGLPGFTASVLATNGPMLHVFRKLGLPMQTHLHGGVVELRIPFPAQ